MAEVAKNTDIQARQQGRLVAHHSVSRAIIVDCDVAEGLPSVEEFGPDGRRWDAAWFVIRVFTEPLGFVKLAMEPGGLTPEQVAAAIEQEHVSVVRDRLEQAGVLWTGRVPLTKVQPPHTPPYVAARELAMRSAPSITVVICTRRRPQGISRILESLVAQSHTPTKVLVVDNAPPDANVTAIVEEFRDRLPISSVEQPRPGLSWARNRGIEASDTEVIAFLDDDEECDPWWYAELARGFVEHPEAEAVSGVILPAELDTPAQWWFESYGGHSKHRGLKPAVFSRDTWRIQSPLYPLPPFGSGGNMAFRRAALERIGRFDVALGAGTLSMGAEDTAAFCLLLYGGGTVVYQPSALVFHTHLREESQLNRVFIGYGRGLTAFYSSVVLRHPKAVLDLIRLSGQAVRDLTSRDGLRLAGLDRDFPESLLRANLRGLMEGPAVYLWARKRARALRLEPPAPTLAAAPAIAEIEASAHAVKVLTIDAEACPDEISATDGGGLRYHGLWLLVRVGGEPRGLVTLEFDGADHLSRAQIEPHLAEVAAEASSVPPVPALTHEPLVSVILCTTFGRLEGVRRCLDSLAALDYQAYEIIVVDNRPSDDVLPDWFGEFPNVRLVREPWPGLSAARNRGLEVATGEIVAFTDDDVVVDPGWLRAIVRRLQSHPDEVAVTGLILPSELETQAQATFEEYYQGFGPRVFRPVSHRLKRPRGARSFRTAIVCEIDDRGEEMSEFFLYEFGHLGTGANMAFRTQVLRDTGGFDIRLGVGTPTQGGEDVDVFVRLIWDGHSLGYDPAALVYHAHRRDDAALRHQVAMFGASYTATLIALTLDDRRHLGAIVATLPQGVRRMGRLFQRRMSTDVPQRHQGSRVSTIPDLARLELLSMAKGPAVYLRSWRRARRASQ